MIVNGRKGKNWTASWCDIFRDLSVLVRCCAVRSEICEEMITKMAYIVDWNDCYFDRNDS